MFYEKESKTSHSFKDKYINISQKFMISMLFALVWLGFSVYLSLPWLRDLSNITTPLTAVLIIAGIGYLPGLINSFIVMSLLLDRQPKFKTPDPHIPISIIIACYNEEKVIANTLRYIKAQDFKGDIRVFVADNGSTDLTAIQAEKAGKELELDLIVKSAERPGKFNALNEALKSVETEYVITLDADTLLHKSAIRFLVSRVITAPADTTAVAGSVLVRNSRDNLLAKIQEWEYFLGIASIKRMQGMYQGTLVAQGAFSLYTTEMLKKVGGWPDAIGEDIVLTWKLLRENKKVYFEPKAVAFTEVPTKFIHFYRQKSRWARGMIEGLKVVKPWQQPIVYIRFLTSINLAMPFLDMAFTLAWIPGLILAFFGIYWIIGPMTLLVLPIAMLQNFILYVYQREVFRELKLNIRNNFLGFIVFVLCYQLIMSPISLVGYTQEIFVKKRVWK
ncbi:biofilm PGA synthesis N-glycosyltransferase PgaC [Alkalibacterium putridalgicola]|uniref:Biofilm PGA synthesis N-glycosyltransferase PgaC n=1 Tax=Alkalibacterium putridalgicola TaxID=426703 RepID=A0A1H7XLC5_9LACT|nr:glycosyltransferase [Alkalibacterium putridalgicola]GEK90322.1 glycosyl transferase [Alkalibacterium putridalgicola]SEM34566.1 biofilm PGA synthesis N-glycosyltransferase PgaC [Alkalibacterium putridalgicola]